MAINSITFNIQEGGLGRAIPGKDYYSGMVFFPATYPTGFSNTDKIKQVFTLEEAEALGITLALYPLEHYHISEYFRMLEKTGGTGVLWIYLGDTVGLETYDGTQITDIQNFADGDLRQVGVYTNETFASSLVTDANTAVEALVAENKPLVVMLAADFSAVADLSTLADIRVLDKDYVGVIISEDGSGVGAALAVTLGKSVSSLGTTMGTIASASVHLNIGWVSAFDVADSVEFQEPAYANGQLVKDISNTQIDAINDLGYISMVKRQEVAGTFHLDSPLTVPVTSDFAYIENARVIQKETRLIRTRLLPFINAPLYVDALTGKMTEATIFQLESAVLLALNQMAVDGEINIDQATQKLPIGTVVIDPDQNVIVTSKVNIVVKTVPVGVIREIEVNIGFVPQIG
jgi:hypothetical protein